MPMVVQISNNDATAVTTEKLFTFQGTLEYLSSLTPYFGARHCKATKHRYTTTKESWMVGSY